MSLIKTFNQKGIGLIETILAIGISIIIVTSMVSLSLFTLRSSLQNKLLLSGTQLANQEIELVRAYRDSYTWDLFIDAVGPTGSNCFVSNCYMSSGSGTISVSSGQQTIGSGTETLTKSFRLTDMSGGSYSLVRVTVTVSWTIGTDVKYAHNYTELSDWRAQ